MKSLMMVHICNPASTLEDEAGRLLHVWVQPGQWSKHQANWTSWQGDVLEEQQPRAKHIKWCLVLNGTVQHARYNA